MYQFTEGLKTLQRRIFVTIWTSTSLCCFDEGILKGWLKLFPKLVLRDIVQEVYIIQFQDNYIYIYELFLMAVRCTWEKGKLHRKIPYGESGRALCDLCFGCANPTTTSPIIPIHHKHHFIIKYITESQHNIWSIQPGKKPTIYEYLTNESYD